MTKVWADFLMAVTKERESLHFNKGEECFYRGHTESSWMLLPTLLRHCLEKGLKLPEQIRDLESALFFEFRSRALELHGLSLGDWDVLFHMRHHGLATRLLDWSEILGVAVYFALRHASQKSTPCIWLLNPYALNELRKSMKVRDLVAPEYLSEDSEYSDYITDYSKNAKFDWEMPVALYPLQKNSRLHAQQGYFTIHGNDIRPLEKIAKKVVGKVPLPRQAWEDAWLFLENAGINEYLLFPDLDGLTRHLHKKYDIAP